MKMAFVKPVSIEDSNKAYNNEENFVRLQSLVRRYRRGKTVVTQI